jgi:hypothetical protein
MTNIVPDPVSPARNRVALKITRFFWEEEKDLTRAFPPGRGREETGTGKSLGIREETQAGP